MDGLQINHLSVWRSGHRTLADINVQLGRGRIAGILGPNGAGKSTLLSAITKQLPYEGTILFEGKTLRSGSFSYLPQSHQTLSGLSVVEVLLLGMHESLGWRVTTAQLDRVNSVLEEFRLREFAERRMDTLSGGQQQRVMLAQRLIRNPQLVLLDEPTSALDLHYQLAAFDILKTYVRHTEALVLVAVHDLNLAAQHCTDLLLLNKGQLVASGPPSEVLNKDCIGETYRIDVDILLANDMHHVIVPLRHRMIA